MSSIVEYILRLVGDDFDKGIDKSKAKVDSLESAIGSIGKTLASIAAVGGALEFVRGSIEMWNEADQASAQLNATLKSTANIAGLSRDALDAQAEALMKVSLFDDDAITGSQALLATFTNIHEEIFMKTVPVIADLAQKMGGDLKGATVQLGKALNDPTQGLSALRRVGVSFSEDQIKVIKNLQETNRLAEAQSMILAELTTEFGGSAQAASEAGTGAFTVLQHQFDNVREDIGKMAMSLVIQLKPALEWFISALKNTVQWIGENTDTIKTGAIAFGVYKIAMLAVIPVMEGFGVAAVAATGPIGLMAVAVAGLTAALLSFNSAQSEALSYSKEWADKAGERETSAITANIDMYKNQYGKSDKEATEMALKYESQRIENSLKVAKSSLISLRQKAHEEMTTGLLANLGFGGMSEETYNAIQKTQDEIRGLGNQRTALDKYGQKSVSTGKALSTAGATAKKAGDKTIERAHGNKSVTINLSIKEFGAITLNATTIKDGIGKISEQLRGALIGVINDSQLTAGV